MHFSNLHSCQNYQSGDITMNENCCCDFFPGTQYCAICRAEAEAEGYATMDKTDDAPAAIIPFSFTDLVDLEDKPKRANRLKAPGIILPEVDIIEVYESPSQENEKRVRVRTRKGLFCCSISKTGGFKIRKVLRTKLPHRQLEIPTVDDEFSSYNGPEQFTHAPYDWKSDYEALKRE